MNMITIFNRQLLYVGYSSEEKNRILAILDKNNLSYSVKEWNARHAQARGRGTIGQLKQYQTTYEIYCKKADYEQCQYLIRLHK